MNKKNPIAERILDWYARHQRNLPWRQTRDPYYIWISEIMLQQTQVETVIPYYHGFLSQFPTVNALAQASLQDVLKAWENLGYYGRARHLHTASRDIVSKWDGKIPRNRDQLLLLPGIGPYTAAAILSIAFGQRIPAVDGNVRRVLCRMFFIQKPIDAHPAQKQINELAENLVPERDPSRFNQGLMDLGATICTPRKPACSSCPVNEFCLAFQKGMAESLPITGARKPLPHKQMTAGIVGDNHGRMLIVQRPIKGLLGGLWKFPGGERVTGKTLEISLGRAIKAELGIDVKVGKELTSVKHAYTHFRITLYAFRCILRHGRPRALSCHDWRWIEPHRLDQFPFSKADRKIMSAL
jgi:A/G-specific adenine glycosylase